VLKVDHGKLKQLIKPVRGFKTLKTAYATIKGFEVMHALRKGQDLVSGVTAATKEELMRIATSELRSFLDKMDAVDLLQQVIAGLVVDVHMQVKFSRSADGIAQPKITKQTSQITVREDEPGES